MSIGHYYKLIYKISLLLVTLASLELLHETLAKLNRNVTITGLNSQQSFTPTDHC